MNSRNIVLVLLLALVVTWCGRPWADETISEVIEKQQFFVETTTVWDLKQSSSLTKNWILIGANTVTVTSQVWWRISVINAQIWDSIGQGWNVITLRDSWGSVSFGVERAWASLEQSRINYESTLLSLDQQIDETRRSVRQAELQQQSAQVQAQNSELEWSSAATLQLQQLEQQLRTAELDLNTKIESDDQTLDNFLSSSENILRDARLLYGEVVNESDEILGVSELNKRVNDRYENYLSARNTSLKFRAESQLRQLLNQQNVLDDLNITDQSLSSDLKYIQDTLKDLTPFLQLLEDVLSYTTTWRDFSELELSGLNQLVDGLQAQVQWQVSWITQQVNGIESFLRVYEDQQQSIRESIDAVAIQVQTTRENLQAAQRSSGITVNTTWIWRESAEARLQDLIQTRGVTEKSLSNSIRQSEIALRETQTNAWKFTVEAPIAWTIWEILIDIGQEVNPWTPLYTITSTNDLEIEIWLTSNEVDLVNEWQSVTVINGDSEFSWTIRSVTRTANQSLSFKATIIPDINPELLWWVVRIIIPLESNQLLLPLKNVQILTTDTGRITTYQNNTIETITVNLWWIQWSNIVVDEALDNELEVIISSVRTFDSEKFVVEKKN